MGQINDFIKQQICALIESRWGYDKIKCHACPTANSVDCGIFAMASLTCFLFDADSKTQHFDEKLL